MRISVRSSTVVRLIGAVTAIWLSGAGSAWAGGSTDAGTLQATLNGICGIFGMNSCPQLKPLITPLVLEIAALANATPEMVRYVNSVPQTAAANAVSPPAGSPFALANVIVPLAFISSGGTAAVTDLNNGAANSFFLAATNGVSGLPPDTLFLFYDYPPLTNPSFARGQDVADITIPLVVLNSNGTESPAPTTIQIRGASGCGQALPCVTATAVGNFGKGTVTRNPADLGITVTLDFSTGHAMFGVQASLLVTRKNDPAYFANPNPLLYNGATFTVDRLGFTPKFLGLAVGAAPVAAQFTANIANDSGANVPAVSAFLAIGTDGETLVSAPLP